MRVMWAEAMSAMSAAHFSQYLRSPTFFTMRAYIASRNSARSNCSISCSLSRRDRSCCSCAVPPRSTSGRGVASSTISRSGGCLFSSIWLIIAWKRSSCERSACSTCQTTW